MTIKLMWIGAACIILGLVIALVKMPKEVNTPWQPSPTDIIRMNAIRPGAIFYSTDCFKGMKLIRVQNSAFYELDETGKPIHCMK